jgi:hypothetical protein
MFRPICRFLTALALSGALAVTAVATQDSHHAAPAADVNTPSTPNNHWCC